MVQCSTQYQYNAVGYWLSTWLIDWLPLKSLINFVQWFKLLVFFSLFSFRRLPAHSCKPQKNVAIASGLSKGPPTAPNGMTPTPLPVRQRLETPSEVRTKYTAPTPCVQCSKYVTRVFFCALFSSSFFMRSYRRMPATACRNSRSAAERVHHTIIVLHVSNTSDEHWYGGN